MIDKDERAFRGNRKEKFKHYLCKSCNHKWGAFGALICPKCVSNAIQRIPDNDNRRKVRTHQS